MLINRPRPPRRFLKIAAPLPHAPRIDAPPPAVPLRIPPIRSLHFVMSAGQVIRNIDVGFARWLYFNDGVKNTGLSPTTPTPIYDDALWLRLDDSAAFKVSQNTYVHLINGFRQINLEYVNIGFQSDGIVFDILYGENSDDSITRPQDNMISWGSSIAPTPGEKNPPSIW